eukprot:TRINITY_DN38958_c0_g1_i1.p1 TRINITY_DN38958_c0_g1~~TRINITY_DN38958_c0_g1_i1.p1  ORF type:complete len:298 (-),score=25.60 TRINITY_DN38958_c0_g1_i1:554-1423(-)
MACASLLRIFHPISASLTLTKPLRPSCHPVRVAKASRSRSSVRQSLYMTSESSPRRCVVAENSKTDHENGTATVGAILASTAAAIVLGGAICDSALALSSRLPVDFIDDAKVEVVDQRRELSSTTDLPVAPPVLFRSDAASSSAASMDSDLEITTSLSLATDAQQPMTLLQLADASAIADDGDVAGPQQLDPATARLASSILGPFISILNFLFIIRIVMSWYPQLPVSKLPYSIAFLPTEPLLAPTRSVIPPIGGVDVAPVIWVAIMSFVNETLLGPQGLLVLLSQQQG